MGIRRTYKVQIGRGHGLYPWCETITSLANNLYNACRFRQRQLITAARKTDRELTDNEKGVIAEFLSVLNCNGRSGLPCLLYKGGIVKSTNQGYNKRLAQIMQEEMKKPGCPKNKEGKPRFVPTEESMGMTLRRNNIVHDFMHKAAKHLVLWCVENRIDTIVGVNAGFKQEVNIGHINNQNFVQIPFAYLRSCIKYLCEEQGILYVKREESYTSKASFPDMDFIPTYGVDDQNVSFSGRRKPTRYRGMYKKGGFRGLYVSGNGAVINSDLNGSANILRKEYPDAFERGEMPDFNKVQVIRHPDQERNTANRETQKKNHTEPSKSKLRRERRKARIFKSNPIKIGLCE